MPTVITKGFLGTSGADGTAAGDYVDEIKVSGKVETITRRGTDGTTKKLDSYDPTNEFSIKGGGAPTLALGVGGPVLSELTGGVKVVDKRDHTQKSNEYDDFEVSGKHAPGAS